MSGHVEWPEQLWQQGQQDEWEEWKLETTNTENWEEVTILHCLWPTWLYAQNPDKLYQLYDTWVRKMNGKIESKSWRPHTQRKLIREVRLVVHSISYLTPCFAPVICEIMWHMVLQDEDWKKELVTTHRHTQRRSWQGSSGIGIGLHCMANVAASPSAQWPEKLWYNLNVTCNWVEQMGQNNQW